MGIYASTSLPTFWIVSIRHPSQRFVGTAFSDVQWYTDNIEGLKSTIVGEGVWRIRKREKATVIETFRIEESGHGNILTRDFLTWRSQSGQGHV